MTLFEAQTGGAFDRLNWQHSGEFDQNFSKKSNARGFARGGMGGFGIDGYIMEVRETTGYDRVPEQIHTSLDFEPFWKLDH